MSPLQTGAGHHRHPTVSVTPTSVNFGNVVVGTTNTDTITLTNSGSANLTISGATVSGSGFSVIGLSLPSTLTPGQHTAFSVVFVPTSAGSVTGSLQLVTNATNSPTTIALSGTGMQLQPQLSVIPTNASFGNVMVGSSSTQTINLTNSGNMNLTLSQASISGAGFSMSGLVPPFTLTPGQNYSCTVQFAPQAPGSFTGSLSLVSNAPNSPTTIALSGTGMQPQLSVIPISASFPNVVVSTTNTQTITLTNSGTANLTISQATLSGNGFSTTGLTLPLALSAGQRTNFNVAFTPASAGSVTGSLSLVSNAANSPATVTLSGSGISPTFLLTASPISLSFGNVAIGSNATQSVSLTNSGNSNVSISQINVSGSGFSESGLTPPLTLSAGQAASLRVVFVPATSGAGTGSVSVVSNATNSPATIALSGSGVQSHSVDLSWNPSASAVVGYNIYRGAQSGGPYTKLNSSLVSATTYTDSNVVAGQTYFYVLTAVDSSNTEGLHSNEVSAAIPSP